MCIVRTEYELISLKSVFFVFISRLTFRANTLSTCCNRNLISAFTTSYFNHFVLKSVYISEKQEKKGDSE